MNKKFVFKFLTALLIIVNMFFIFHFSAEKASVSKVTSKNVTEKMLNVTVKDFKAKPEPVKKDMIKTTDSKIRTLAHFSEYTALGFLVALHLSLYKLSKIKNALLSFAGCAMYSVIDEIHQIYVPGRSFQLSDILTDSAGSLLGILIILSIIVISKKLFNKNKTAVN